MDEVELLVLNAISRVRPNGIEVDAYPQIVSMIINLVTLELTNGQVATKS